MSELNDQNHDTGSTEASSASPPKGSALLVAVAAVAVALRIPAYLASRHLSFDDGVFASSVIAMRDGGVPFRQVFSSQGPLFLPLAYVGDLIGLRTLDAPRVAAVVSGVVVTVMVFLTVRSCRDTVAATYGALIVATSGCIMWVTGPLAADGPALAFAAVTFWLIVIYLDRPGPSMALWLGLAAGASMSVKAIHLPLLFVTAAALLTPMVRAMKSHTLGPSVLRDPLIAGAAATAVFIGTSLPFGLGNVWDQTFVYRTETSNGRDPLANLRKIVSTLWDRDLVLWLLVVVTIVWVVQRARSAARATARTDGPAGSTPAHFSPAPWRPSPLSLAVIWLGTEVVWLAIGVNPMWRSHVSGVVLPLALVVALCAPPLRWLTVMAVVSVPLVFLQLDGLLAPGPYKGSELQVVTLLRELPEGAWALSDDPGLIWRAGRRTTDDLVDPSVLRIWSGRYDETSVVTAAREPHVCAVVVRSRERFGSFPGLGRRLAQAGYRVELAGDTLRTAIQRVYVKADCNPGS